MTRKLGLMLASVAAVAIVAVGMTYACGDSCKNKANSKASLTSGSSCSASASSACCKDGAKAKNASNASCSATCKDGAKASMASGSGCSSTCKDGAKASMASGSGCSSKGASASSGCCMSKSAGAKAGESCGSKNADMAALAGNKGYYCANCFECKDGNCMAVYKGSKFAVTESTPYTQVGNARYYFTNSECAVKCQESLKAMAGDLEKETVSLATAEANIVEQKEGEKWAQCKMSGHKFQVTSATPVRMIDGQKYYFCSDACAGKETASLKTANMETSVH